MLTLPERVFIDRQSILTANHRIAARRVAIAGNRLLYIVELPDAGSDAPPEVVFGIDGRFRRFYGVYDTTSLRFAITLQFEGSK